MNKIEFLRELENGLDGRLPESDMKEILSDYRDIFENGMANGKGEEDIAAEIGSPGRIARTILEDGLNEGNAGNRSGSESQREYTDFQQNINEKTSKFFDKIVTPDSQVKISSLAPMSRRLGAFVLDFILMGLFFVLLFIIFLIPLGLMRTIFLDSGSFYGPLQNLHYGLSHFVSSFGLFAFGNIGMLLFTFGTFNLFGAIILWATDGYTPGKWILKMKVVKLNGQKLTFVDALLREVVIKSIANSFLSGFLNVGSFIWAYATEDNKTVHDLVAQTRVITVERGQTSSKNPLES